MTHVHPAVKLIGKLCVSCIPEKLAFMIGCKRNHKEIRVSLVLESFSKEPCILGKSHLSESLRVSHGVCFCVLDSGKDKAALASPPTCGHLTAYLLEVIWLDLVSSVQDPHGVSAFIFRLKNSPFAYLLTECYLGDCRFYAHKFDSLILLI